MIRVLLTQALPYVAALTVTWVIVVAAMLRSDGPMLAVLAALSPFVAWLMVIVAGQSGRKLSVLWNRLMVEHHLWFTIFCSGLVFRSRNLASIQESPVDGFALFRMVLVLLTGVVLLRRFLFKEEFRNSLHKGLIGHAVLFGIFALSSTVWSVNPMWTAYKSVEFLIDIGLMAAILTAAPWPAAFKGFFDYTWVLMSAMLVSVAVGVVAWPDVSLVRGVGSLGVQLEGVIPKIAANGVGELSAVVGIVCICRFLNRTHKAAYGIVLLLAMVALIFSQTRSALLGLLLGLVVILVCGRQFGFLLCMTAMAALVFLTTDALETTQEFLTRGQDAQLVGSLSGRTDWWGAALAKVTEKPLIGFGAFSGGRFVALVDSAQETSSVHNDFIEVLAGSGAIGLTLVVTLFLRTAWRTIRNAFTLDRRTPEGQLAIEAAAVLAVLSVRSIFTTTLFWHPPLAFLLVLGYSELLVRRQERLLAAAIRPRTNLQPRVCTP